MGDRANFGFKSGNDTIFLYGHWAGEGMLSTLAHAIEAASGRWSDEAYATRICTTYIVNQDRDSLSETGWGISVNGLSDNEHKVPVVKWGGWNDPTASISLYEENDAVTQSNPIFTMSLLAFIGKFAKADA